MAFMAIMMILGVAMAGLAGGGSGPEEGSDASEKYTGTDGDDRFDASAGNDLVLGRGGDDTLEGGDGADWLIGSTGDDNLSGSDGDDVIVGGGGADRILAGSGDDFVEAANVVNNEVLDASLEDANSFSTIQFEYDLPNASDEGDEIRLGAGNDTVVLGSDDTLVTGAGDDLISFGDWSSEDGIAKILDFDPQADLLLYTYNSKDGAPELALQHDNSSHVTSLVVDGSVRAELHNLETELHVSDIKLVTYG